MLNVFSRISQWIVSKLENFFAWYGSFVARHPFVSIVFCLVTTGLAAIGMIRYRTENNAFKLWIPDNSDFVSNYAWLEENSPPDIRFNSLLLASDNILTPSLISHLASIHKKVDGLDKWSDYCYQLPVAEDSPPDGEIPEECNIPTPWLEPCYPTGWCSLIDQETVTTCFEKSLLELWGYLEPAQLSSLTQQEILDKVNEDVLISTVFGTPITVTDYLGDVEYNSTGHIISAKATYVQWYGKINASNINSDDVNNMGTGEIVDQQALDFEEVLRDLLMEDREDLPNEVTSFINVARGYSDIAGDTIVNDAMMMPIGFMIVFVYVTVMLGKFSCVEQRSILALCGLAAIGLTIGFTYGFCSGLNLFYGPMHNIIPFLLLGIGIDDMFVIIQCYDNLSLEERQSDDIVKTISLTMRRAGVAITVTSLTDFMVFAIGSSTVLPALRSFCAWCAVGILAVYFYQATFFTACLALDCRRLKSNRNGLCPCYTHKEKEATKEKEANNEKEASKEKEATKESKSDLSLSQRMFQMLGSVVLSTIGTVIVLLMAAGLLGGGVYGCTLLQQKFDPVWFLPPSSYLSQWFSANSLYFPGDGERVTVYLTQMDYTKEMDKIERLVENLSESTDIIKVVDSWYPSFKEFLNTDLDENIPTNPLKNSTFSNHLTQYLYNADPIMSGLRYQPNFKYVNSELECGESAPDILLSTFTFTHVKFSGRSEHIPALNKVKKIISDCQFSGTVFALPQEYSNWETDEVITEELLRNLGLALACVYLTTFLLLADFIGSLLVLLCVAITLVDLCGYMHFWGLTIDVVSSVNIIIAIGLCVDYSVHICHAFLTVSGTRKERALAAMVDMGPAVLNGGLSTLIAFILLAGSDSHVFSSFFKIFLLVVVIGVWHGLVLLPVLLSLVGPASYSTETSSSSSCCSNDHSDDVEMKGDNQ